MGVDSGVLVIEACIVSAMKGTALGVTGREARIVIDQCHIKDSAFGVACVLGARLSCSRSLLSELAQAAIVAVGNGSICELESNTISAGGAYGMSVTEGAKAILEGNSFMGAQETGISISGKLSCVLCVPRLARPTPPPSLGVQATSARSPILT